MSRQDPGAATGQQPYEPTRCTCGCLSTLHRLNDAGKRTSCSNSNCLTRCRKFTEEVACARCENAAVGVCCTAHGKQLCHSCYRRTHFVEVCVPGCPDCARENLEVTR